MSLTSKQDKFARLVASGKTQADAYRGAYDVGKNTKAETVINKASELMRNGDIKARVEGLQEKAAEKSAVTLEGLTKDLRLIHEMALMKDDSGKAQLPSAVKSVETIAKLHGLMVDKRHLKVDAKSLSDVIDELDE